MCVNGAVTLFKEFRYLKKMTSGWKIQPIYFSSHFVEYSILYNGVINSVQGFHWVIDYSINLTIFRMQIYPCQLMYSS